MKKRVYILFLILIVFSTTGLSCTKSGDLAAVKSLKTPITLNWWQVYEGQENFQAILADFKKSHPNITINYRLLRYEEYEQALLEGWAADEGPDIFTIHNNWVKKYNNKILPLPAKIKLPYAESYSRTGQVEKAFFRETPTYTPQTIKRDFVDVVAGDVINDKGEILGLPLSVDTLALFYNRDLLDQAKVFNPPQTWAEVLEASKKITLQDNEGNIIRSGLAFGGIDNVNNIFDIISLLMLQNGTQMFDAANGSVTFNQPTSYAQNSSYYPGAEAVRFYSDFAMPSREAYTWNETMPEAQEAFVRGNLGMMLGYAYQIPFIKAQGSRLNWGVVKVPHINSNGMDTSGYETNYASYWLQTVSKKTKYPDEAWGFVSYLTSTQNAERYLSLAKKPAALRSVLEKQFADPEITVFANQALTAKSWYKGMNVGYARDAFKNMIKDVVVNQKPANEVINFTAQQVTQTLR